MEFFSNLMSQFILLNYRLTEAIGFPSYALAIVILGIIVRVLLLPLSIKQMKSTLGMSEVQPLMKDIQTKYANNREKLAEEMSKLYKEYDVNPTAGCLPILIQMPILYFLFRALRTYNFSENASFFWINSLNEVDTMHILPIILGVVMFIQQKLTIASSGNSNGNAQLQMQMKMMVYFMPIMMGVFALQFPSGLCLYWITTSVFMIFQTFLMAEIRKKELEERRIAREKREEERAQMIVEQQKAGQNKSKKKSKQQLKNEHKARKREANATYKAPSKDGSDATYHAPKTK